MSADHYFTAEPSARPDRHRVEFTVAGRDYSLLASGGVFSSGRLDPGTAVLLRKAPLPGPGGGVYLDLGCGYGPITAVLARSSPRATVYAVDVNSRALELVRDNAAELGVASQVITGTPDEVPADVVFDEIWSNPPIRVGKAELHAMLGRWLPRLVAKRGACSPPPNPGSGCARPVSRGACSPPPNPGSGCARPGGGTAWLVVARHLGADSLQEWLTAHGWPAQRYASQKGYRVLRVGADIE